MTSALEAVDSLRQVSDEPAPLLLTVEAAAARLGIGRTFAYALVKSGELESVPVGRRRRIPAECITEYVRRLRDSARRDQTAA
jgi:excisionase family DNA binding protein